jgi:ribosomal protein S18 acetylase RimI-like enzyme
MSDATAELQITQASVTDAEAILALQKLAYRSEAEIYDDFAIPPLRQTLAEMRQDIARQLVLMATLGGRVVGSVRGHEREGTCHIGRLIVDPSCQNRGIGRRLMAAIEERFRGVRRYELFTGHRSERNLALYRKLGYVAFRTETASDSLCIVCLEKTHNDFRYSARSPTSPGFRPRPKTAS